MEILKHNVDIWGGYIHLVDDGGQAKTLYIDTPESLKTFAKELRKIAKEAEKGEQD